MKSLVRWAPLAAMLVMGGANAALTKVDVSGFGSQMGVQDSASGLTWLNLSATAGKSADDVSALLSTDPSWSGWRYATKVEYLALVKQFGVDTSRDFIYMPAKAADLQVAQQAALYLGDLDPAASFSTIGMLAEDNGQGSRLSAWLLYYPEGIAPTGTPYPAVYGQYFNTYLTSNNGFDHVGSLLVQANAVPEPSAWLLLLTGLGSLALFRRRGKGG